MSRWRIAVLVMLTVAPFLGLAGVGLYFLWERGLSMYTGWIIAAFFAAAYGLAWYWQRTQQLVLPISFRPSLHWTDRDREAWQLVEARAKQAAQFDPERLSDVPFYVSTAQEMAYEL